MSPEAYERFAADFGAMGPPADRPPEPPRGVLIRDLVRQRPRLERRYA